MLKYVVDSKSPLLNPSKNPLIGYLLRKTIYNHFCAGTIEAEVRKTVQDMKTLGFKGVILGYARESIAKADENDNNSFQVEKSQQAIQDQAVEEWRQGNLRTLKMIGAGDFLGIK
jgi:nicotinamidase-related amidase